MEVEVEVEGRSDGQGVCGSAMRHIIGGAWLFLVLLPCHLHPLHQQYVLTSDDMIPQGISTPPPPSATAPGAEIHTV
ncbi:hypothetical protein Hypma_007047 [Hypsizygus marmoreus]|uniref:Uncharacterized protein n=1 Tax=Hypsizygus marmoreus TaxID=39966 RepID=A0A369KBR6_HYPMA|nr:hypothetical protein Hypma_007047 [Hypsizygus marmoreus]